jgi:hypothetical protein
MKFAGIENPSECSSRRKEAQIHRTFAEQPNMESPYVISYKFWI